MFSCVTLLVSIMLIAFYYNHVYNKHIIVSHCILLSTSIQIQTYLFSSIYASIYV